ncbi:MAG TPA: hypothetical protein VGE46_07625 [Bdellovibrio sp.]
MKLFGALLVLLASTNALGKVLTCKVIASSSSPAYLEVALGRAVENINFIQQVSQNDGTVRKETQTLYAAQIRGGRSITFCNPDDNQVVEATGKIRTHSHCFNDTGELFFGAYLSTKVQGELKLRILESNGSVVSLNLKTQACVIGEGK